MCPIGRCTKINTGLSPSASLLYHTGAFLSTAFRGLFPYASPGKRRSFMIHGSTILARGKHGRLYGGCPPCLLYHTHLGKSIGFTLLAERWHNIDYELLLEYLGNRISDNSDEDNSPFLYLCHSSSYWGNEKVVFIMPEAFVTSYRLLILTFIFSIKSVKHFNWNSLSFISLKSE